MNKAVSKAADQEGGACLVRASVDATGAATGARRKRHLTPS
jgi:hypothetical protein